MAENSKFIGDYSGMDVGNLSWNVKLLVRFGLVHLLSVAEISDTFCHSTVLPLVLKGLLCEVSPL